MNVRTNNISQFLLWLSITALAFKETAPFVDAFIWSATLTKYLVPLFTLILCLHAWPHLKNRHKPSWFIFTTIILFYIVHAFKTYSYVTDGKFILIAISALALTTWPLEYLLKQARCMLFFMGILTTVSLLVYGLLWAGCINLKPWHVSELTFINKNAPIYTRWLSINEPLHNVYYLLTVASNQLNPLLGVDFYRFAGPFTEPSFLAYILCPLTFIACYFYKITKAKIYLYIISLFVVSVILSASIIGYLAYFLAFNFIALRLILNKQLKNYFRPILLILLTLITFLLIFKGKTLILSIAGFKASEIEYYQSAFSSNISQMISLWGSGYSNERMSNMASLLYGKLSIIYIQGILGLTFVVLIPLASFAYITLRLLEKYFIWVPLAGVSSIIIFLKIAFPIHFFMIFVYALILRYYIEKGN